MKMSKWVMAFLLTFCVAGTGSVQAGWPPVKGRSLGAYQQQTLARGFGAGVGAGVTTATGSPVAGAVVGYGVGNHAAKKWTGKGLQNWNKPKRW